MKSPSLLPGKQSSLDVTSTEDQEIGGGGQVDSLLSSLKKIASWHGAQICSEQACSGLPLINGSLTPALLLRAAKNIGFRAKLVRRSLKNIPSSTLPVILLLKGNKSGVLQVEENGEVNFIIASQDEPCEWLDVPAGKLKKMYSGYAVFVRPIHYEEEPQSIIDIGDSQDKKMHWFWDTMWQFKGELLRLLPISILINLFALCMPLFIMSVYDRVVPNNAEETLWVLGLGAIIVFTFEYAMRLLRGHLLNQTGKQVDGVLASALYDQIMAINMNARPLQTGILTGKARGYEALRDFFTSAALVAMVDVPFSILMISMIFYLAGGVGWIPLGSTVFALAFGLMMQVPLRKAVVRAYREGIERQSFLTETIFGIETIKVVNAQNTFQRRMENMIREASSMEVKSHWYSLVGTSTTIWYIHLTTIFLVIACVYRIYEGSLTMGGMVACVILTSRAMTPLNMVSGLMTRFQQMVSSLKGLHQVMCLPREYGEEHKFTTRENFSPDFVMENVVMKYPKQVSPALNNVSLRIAPGESIGIVGQVGSGKSTLLKILVKLYEPDEGEIMLDGLDLSQFHPVTLRRHIGFLPQNPSIFHGTIRDNVALGAPWATDGDVLEALSIAGMMPFINHSPLGMNSPVGEQGICLSGGQCEAIALARCMLRKPKVLLLDEPTSSMDVNTEDEVLKNIKTYIRQDLDRTLVISTHKLHLLDAVQRVIVMSHGQIISDGPRDEIIHRRSTGHTQRVSGKRVV